MLEAALKIDRDLFIFLNSLHHPYLDHVMLFLSNSLIPILCILGLFFIYGLKKYKSKIFLIFIFLIITFGMTDIISSRVLKPTTQRLRPCHETIFESYRAGNGCGGKFSFVSAHASNYFSVLTFIWLIFGRFNKAFLLVFPYAALVSYSRIYLARHYFLDIFFGAILGIFIAAGVFQVLKRKTNLLKY